MNSLFLITYDDPDWDQYFGFVISAPTSVEASEIAKQKVASAYQPHLPTIKKIATGTNEPTGIVIDSFNAG